MDNGKDLESGKLQSQLQSLTAEIRTLAESCQGDSLLLLAVLRALEGLHREIRDGLFQASLPDNRQALYKLLKDMESEGGWPYIQRMKLRSLLECDRELALAKDAPTEAQSDSVNSLEM